ncbi:MAG: Hint domain-containing protein [Rhodospirillales bacterium]|nr:Hint domain-containing protein [Rhodospirillales bacterium]
MAGLTIKGTIAGPVTFSAAYSNYITVTPLGAVTSATTAVSGTGTLVNSGLVEGGSYGFRGAGAVIDSGTIAATAAGGFAVSFANAAGNLLGVVPGAVLIGTVAGGGAGNELVFGAGAGIGTIHGLGSHYVNFDQVSIQSGATWASNTYGTLAAGQTLGNSGTLLLTSHLFTYGSLTNAGLVEASFANAILSQGVVTNTGTISQPNGIGGQALFAHDTVVNSGVISGYGNAAVKIVAGVFDNQAGGRVVREANLANSGYGSGLYAKGGVSVVNDGLIAGGVEGVYSAAYPLTNLAQGTITGLTFGVLGTGTVINAGTIAAGNARLDAVTLLAAAGNRVVVDPGAVFVGTIDGGNAIGSGLTSTLEFATGSGAGTFAGLGTHYVDFAQVSIDAGATWLANASNTLAAHETLTNAGSLTASGIFANAGLITATASAAYAVALASGTLTNSATILAAADGALARSGGTLVNGALISAAQTGVIANGGEATNQSGGVVVGGFVGAAVAQAGATLANAGYVSGGQDGVFVLSGASVVNAANATIKGGNAGVVGSGTLVNAGTITAVTAGQFAVSLQSGTDSRLVVDPGAVFAGAVEGGNAIGGAATSTLVFAGGASQGTFSALGSHYADFAAVSIDSNASWIATGTNSVVAGQALTDAGTLANVGQLSVAGNGLLLRGMLANEARATIAGATYAVAGYGTVVNAGTIAALGVSPDAVVLAAGHANRVVVEAGATFIGTVDGGNPLGAASASTLEFGAGTGTINGLGSHYVDFAQISIDLGGTWSVAAGASIAAGQTVSSNGLLVADSTLTNAGLVAAAGYGLDATGGFVTNTGTISAGNLAVLGAGVATLVNTGLLTAGGAAAVSMQTGAVSNAGGGRIVGGSYAGVKLAAATSLTNDAAVSGAVYGVVLSGGVLINDAHGAIAGGALAVSGSGTVINGGTIGQAGAARGAVALAQGAGNRVVVDPGAAFVGAVSGGGAGSTLEFASGAAYGTLSGLGVQYANFAQVSIDGAARWVAAGSNSIVAGQTLTDAGRLAALGTFVNAGLVTGALAGIYYGGGTFTNSGTILSLNVAMHGNGGGGQAVNHGLVSGALSGLLETRGSVTNAADGTIVGGQSGIEGFGTVVDAGTVAAGAGGYAVSFAAGYDNRLVVDPGAVFDGKLGGGNAAGGAATSTLEFAAGSGTLSGFGSSVLDFGQITLDAQADWLLAGTASGFEGGTTISGLSAGSTIELLGTVESFQALAAGMLTLSGGTTLDLPGVAVPIVSNDGVNTFITACFATGTKITVARGEVAVEDLLVGDAVPTVSGRLARVSWIGHRRTDLRRHPSPGDVMPVRVRAGALGNGAPVRDLVLSPDHAVLVDGCLVPIRHLVNNVSIVQETRDSVTYWHVELDRHDVLLAEGLACESYLDTGNRCAFDNAPGAVAMTPDFARRVWVAEGCAPILTDAADPSLRALHLRLLARAGRRRESGAALRRA